MSVLLSILTVAVFGQTGGFDFVNFDDPLHLPDHLEVEDGLSAPGILWAFTENFGGNYIPITALTFLADFQVHRLEPGGYHQTNVFLHVANVLLLFVFLFRTTARLGPSALVAVLFAIHPLHVESVAWVSARKDLVSTFFWLTALIAYASYARRPRIAPYVLTLALLVLGLLSKSMLVTFPFVLLLLDVWPLRRIDLAALRGADARRLMRRLVLEKIPFLIPVVAVSVATAVLQNKAGAMASVAALPIPDRIANAFITYVAYLGKALWPVDLIVVYPHRTLELMSLQVLAAVVLLTAITIVVVLARTRAPYLIVGWLWYVGTLVPVIGLVQVGNQAMADRYTYVSLIGIFIAVAWGADDLTRVRPRIRLPAVAVALGVVAALSIVSTRQVAHWENSIELFEHAIRVNPQNRSALTNLGAAYIKGERTDEAITVIEAAIKLDPGSLANHQNLGNAYRRAGRYEDAREHLAHVIRLAPDDARSQQDMGLLLLESGELVKARRRFEKALDIDPEYVMAHVNLGNVFLGLQRFRDAIPHYWHVLDRNPDHPEALTNMGAALITIGEYYRAASYLQRSLALLPEDTVTRLNLAVAYYELGRKDEARAEAERALRADPSFTRAQEFLRMLDP